MYIGAEPNIGNYSMLDAITTSATATYNLLKGGASYTPENPLGVICSLNGVIQKAGSSFNIVNNTIVFSQALTSNDSIDFILVMGERIDLNVPADASVNNAKTNFVSTSSNAGLSIKGDGTTDGTLQLNCSQNSHGIKIKSPPHSASASYTLTMPNNDGSSGEALTTDGSGVLSWASAGGSNTPAFLAYANGDQYNIPSNTYTKLANYISEVFDTDNKFASSRFTPGVVGNYFIYGTAYLTHTGSDRSWIAIYKNGSINTVSADQPESADSYPIQVSGIVNVTNTSDYIEIFVRNSGSSTNTAYSSGVSITFGGYKIIE